MEKFLAHEMCELREDEMGVPLRVVVSHVPVSREVEPLRSCADYDLIEISLGGDSRALSVLLDRHYDRLHRVIWRILGSKSDAEDVTQEVCCTIIERIATFRGDAKFSTWLMGIAINACRDHQRRTRSSRKLLAAVTSVLLSKAPNDGRDLYRQSWLANELSHLDMNVREAIVLIVGEDFTHAEAAASLGVAESTVSGWVHGAKRTIAAKTRKDSSNEA